MGEIASRSQLRMSYLRWALVCVPAIILLGLISSRLSGAGADGIWFERLAKPSFMPPSWLFPVAWTILYALMGFALAIVFNARRARGKGAAIGLFVVQLALNLFWSPLFFGAHQIHQAFFLILAILAFAVLTAIAFARIRALAGWLLVPYLLWLGFASALNYSVDQLNPGAESLAVPASATNIGL